MGEIILVCGFGRCGSSLTMQMLKAGGVPTVGDAPAFEPQEANPLNLDPFWLVGQAGKAVKIIGPLEIDRPLLPAQYRVIWLDRDPMNQARSAIKMVRLLSSVVPNRAAVRAMAASYRHDRPAALDLLRQLGPVLELRFEKLIADPPRYAAELAAWVGIDDPTLVRAMASVVLPRGPSCQPDMSIELSLIEAAA